MTLSLLVLGGTSWLGGEVARQAAAHGHRVTCLARGESGDPPPQVTWVRADRDAPGGYDTVRDTSWDAVVDVSWQPRQVRTALEALADRAGFWAYVSSGSVYADVDRPGGDVHAPLTAPFEGDGIADLASYGAAKVACEDACREAVAEDRLLLARAGLIGGYGDRSDRLGYWPARMASANDDEAVLVPPLDAPLQVVDVVDLAAWLVRAAERRTCGVVDAVGEHTTLGTAVEAAVTAAGTRPRLVEADDAFLTAAGVAPFMGPDSLPLWLPQPDYAGFMTRDEQSAREAGLRRRPLAETVADALRWERERGLARERTTGLTPQRERTLLDESGA